MSGLKVGERWWDTRRTETGGVGPRDDRACEPISGPSPAVEMGSAARFADDGITGCLCRGGETKQMDPDRPTGDGRGLVHRLLRVRRPNSGYQALISPLKAQQDKVIAHPRTNCGFPSSKIMPLLRAGEGVASAGSGGAAPGRKTPHSGIAVLMTCNPYSEFQWPRTQPNACR
jgi:hypothetical protein